ncbi:MAG: Si-specific NAD(P)(+) transhydrogenase [Gemmataceae bacterium]
MSIASYDLIVIGSGPAGEKGAARAAYFGKKVALVEKEPVLGGAAANTGTLPSKTLRETAVFLSGFRNRQLEGLDVRGLKRAVTVRDFMTRERYIVDRERCRIQENLRRHNIDVYHGTASFADAKSLAVQPADGPAFQVHGEHFLIATGSAPFRPRQFDFHDPRIFDSDTILNLPRMPHSLLVLGGGVVGCEYACMFAILGIQVYLVEKRDRLLTFLDGEISLALQTEMQKLGIHLYLGDGVKSLDASGENLHVHLESGGAFQVDSAMVSSGRSGNVAALHLDRIGVAVDERGRVKVNPFFQTNVAHVYAAGDVIGNPALASTAMEQGRIAMTHAFQFQYLDGRRIEALAPILPYGIYTIPECSTAGETEESLQAAKTDYVAGRAHYKNNARGQIVGDAEGFLKLLFRTSDMKLLGAHVIGEQATELVHIGLMALIQNAGADLFIETCFNYPTLSELYKYATFDALGQRDRKQREQAAGAGS